MFAKHHKKWLGLLIALTAATVLTVEVALPSASGGTYQPLDPTTAATYATTGSGPMTATDGQGTPVSPATVAQEDGVSLATVEGLSSTATSASVVLASSTARCWTVQDNSTMATWWGLPPYQQNVSEFRHWCAQYFGGPLTYVTTSAHLGSHYLCSTSGAYDKLYSGGTGHTWVTRTTGGSFSCPTIIPWVNLHYSRWQRWKTTTLGRIEEVAHS